jgi:hypothetical protein
MRRRAMGAAFSTSQICMMPASSGVYSFEVTDIVDAAFATSALEFPKL